MTKTNIQVKRISVVSDNSFEETVKRLTATIGRADLRAFHDSIMEATTIYAMEEVVRGVIGSSELMEFVRFDAGEILGKEHSGKVPKTIRFLIGNPIIMKAMAKTVPDAAAYAPVTILVDERADGVHLSYDSMESLIGSYGSPSALEVAINLDKKIERLLETAALSNK